jgi:3-(3-hydroxy-phenyl)propionate hydroxylase
MLRQGRGLEPRQGLSRDRKVFEFNLLPEGGHKFPAFINLQQPYFEQFLHDRVRAAQAEGAPIEIRGKNRVDAVDLKDDHVDARHHDAGGALPDRGGLADRVRRRLVAAARMLGCGFDRTGVRGQLPDRRHPDDSADFPTERWFWFEPPQPGAHRRSCTSSPTISGGSTSRSAGTSTARKR